MPLFSFLKNQGIDLKISNRKSIQVEFVFYVFEYLMNQVFIVFFMISALTRACSMKTGCRQELWAFYLLPIYLHASLTNLRTMHPCSIIPSRSFPRVSKCNRIFCGEELLSMTKLSFQFCLICSFILFRFYTGNCPELMC